MTTRKILVWDAPTRVVHWAMAVSFLGAFLTSESERYQDVHILLGYTLLGLVAFRILWGFVGTRYARFSTFAYGPRQVLAYLKSLVALRPQHFVGHNPAASVAIWALFLLALLTGVTGYFTYAEVGKWAEELHEGLASAMLGVVFIHVAGVLTSSLLHRENLVRSMLTGYKLGRAGEGIRAARWWAAALVIVVITAFWSGVVPVSDLTPGADSAGKHPPRHASMRSDG